MFIKIFLYVLVLLGVNQILRGEDNEYIEEDRRINNIEYIDNR